jgi:glutathione S-transferase
VVDIPILYSFRRCPYAMRARMALLVSGTTVRLREILLRDKPVEMLLASPKATVPVLVLPDGRVIDESLDIMHWALGQNDPEHWLEGADEALIAANDGPFKAALDRYKYPHRYDVDPTEHRDAAAAHLERVETRLADRAFVHGAKPGLSDVALFPFIRQFAATDVAWFAAQPWPMLQTWFNTLTTAPLFEACMQRLAPWHPGDAEPLLSFAPDAATNMT